MKITTVLLCSFALACFSLKAQNVGLIRYDRLFDRASTTGESSDPAWAAYTIAYHKLFETSGAIELNNIPTFTDFNRIPSSKLKLEVMLPFTELNALHTPGFELTLSVIIRPLVKTNGVNSWGEIVKKDIKINYNRDSGIPYRESEWLIIENISYAEIVVEKISGKYGDENLLINLSNYIQVDGTEPFIFEGNNELTNTDIENFRKFPFELKASILSETVLAYNARIQPYEGPNCQGLVAELTTSNDVIVRWCNTSWADEYELQWTFVDDYPPLSSAISSNLQYSFRNNYGNATFKNGETNTGLTNSYKLPLICERGYLIFRIRGKKYLGPNNSNPFYGPWSFSESGTMPSGSNNRFIVRVTEEKVHEEGWFNWQKITKFAENGKRKDIVAYYDATMRQRQIVTRTNDDNTVIVAETIYDRQGRPSVNVLPSAVKCENTRPLQANTPPASNNNNQSISAKTAGTTINRNELLNPVYNFPNLSTINLGNNSNNTQQITSEVVIIGGNPVTIPRRRRNTPTDFSAVNSGNSPSDFVITCEKPESIRYYPNFNLSQNRLQPYSFEDFDNPAVEVSAMSSENGASRFFSPNNEDRDLSENAFIPNAEGYPFSFTEYENSPTQRIKKTYGLGAEFRQGSGKEVSYDYTRPVQEELDRIFGTDAGIASYYTKNIVTDGNGQQSIQYQNASGKTVATALAGDVPPHLEPAGYNFFELNINLLDGDQMFTENGIPYREASFPLTVESDNQEINFKYILNFVNYNTSCNNICLDCVYDLRMSVQTLNCIGNPFDTLIFKLSISGSDLVDYTCNSSGNLPVNFKKKLRKGSYLISRRLSINEGAMQLYLNKVQSVALSEDRKCLSPPDPVVIQPCEIDCEPCRTSAIKPDWCATYCDDNPCKRYLDAMLRDLSPGGQYGDIDSPPESENGRRSVYKNFGRSDCLRPLEACGTNSGTIQRALSNYNWRKPMNSPFNLGNQYNGANGYQSEIVENYSNLSQSEYEQLRTASGILENRGFISFEDATGSVTIKKPELAPLSVFLRHWQPSWAKALLPYHPEFCELLYCHTFTRNHENAINSFKSLGDTRKIVEYMNNPEKLVNDDILFRGENRTPFKQQMLSRVNGRTEEPVIKSYKERILVPLYCQNPNNSSGDIAECLRNRRFGDDPVRLSREWMIFIGVYAQERRELEEQIKLSMIGNQDVTQAFNTSNTVLASGNFDPFYCFPTKFIGNTSIENNPYSSAVKHFPKIFESSEEITNTLGCDEPNCEGRAQQTASNNCNACRETTHLNVLLAALALDGRLTVNIEDELANKFAMTRELLDLLPNKSELKYSWNPQLNGKELMARITSDGREQAVVRMRFEKDNLDWSKVRRVMCMEDISQPFYYRYLTGGKHFIAKVYFNDNTEALVEGHFSLGGASTNCGNQCRLTEDGKVIYAILKNIIDNNNLRRTTILHRAGERLPDFIPSEFLPTNDRNYQGLQWRFNSESQTGSLVVSYPRKNQPEIRCRYEFTFPRNLNVNAQIRVTGFRPDSDESTSSDCNRNSFNLVVQTFEGLRILKVKQLDQCFELVNCCGCDNYIVNGEFNDGTIRFNSLPNGSFGLGSYNELGEVFDRTPDARIETQSRTIGSRTFNFGNGCYINRTSVRYAAGTVPDQVIIWNQRLNSRNLRIGKEYSFGFIVKELVRGASLSHLKVIYQTSEGAKQIDPYVSQGFAGFKTVKCHFKLTRGDNPTIMIVYSPPTAGDANRQEELVFAIDNISLNEMGCNTSCCIPTPPQPLPITRCDENQEQLARELQRQKDIAETERLVNRIRYEYTRRCMQSAESFMAKKVFKIYHYTLFYYDQAGNLIKTIPPEGVFPLETHQLEEVKSKRSNQTFNNAENANNKLVPVHALESTYLYNTYNQVVSKNSPDAGSTVFTYDELGRVHLSRDARMMASNERKTAYVLYDEIGRVFESGIILGEHLRSLTYLRNHVNLKNLILTKPREEVSRFYYDNPMAGMPADLSGKQKNLRNRISSVNYYLTFNNSKRQNEYDHATFFNYDIHGNSKDVWQHARYDVIDPLHQLKHIHYKYDLASGLTNEVIYQPGKADQFIHQYKYDADNRLLSVHTGTHLYNLRRDIKYSYYKHGPLARKEYGSEGIILQGMDYAYTLNGALKVINSTALRPGCDMGKDSLSDARSAIPADVYGYTIYYHENDFKPIGNIPSANMPTALLSGSVLTNTPEYQGKKGLYNGNIMATASSFGKLQTTDATFNAQPLLNSYRYDQLGRIRNTQVYSKDEIYTSNSWASSTLSNKYSSSYEYDQNGNITRLSRYSQDGTQFDNLSYHYQRDAQGKLISNRLNHITDPQGFNNSIGDLSSQNLNNYQYDEVGNLKRDVKDNLSFEWTYKGRIKQVQSGSGSSTQYQYDAFARRIIKTNADGSTTYYVCDASGNIMAVYLRNADGFKWDYSPLYGASRIGTYEANILVGSALNERQGYFEKGKKRYELNNHLGDVAVLISDKKNIQVVPELAASSGIRYEADVLYRSDYYPFGMQMPGRFDAAHAESKGKYAYAYNGMERDKKAGADGYTTEFRQYDPRVGRWMSVDPLAEKYASFSSYSSFELNPISMLDPNGAESKASYKQSEKQSEFLGDKDKSSNNFENAKGLGEYFERGINWVRNQLGFGGGDQNLENYQPNRQVILVGGQVASNLSNLSRNLQAAIGFLSQSVELTTQQREELDRLNSILGDLGRNASRIGDKINETNIALSLFEKIIAFSNEQQAFQRLAHDDVSEHAMNTRINFYSTILTNLGTVVSRVDPTGLYSEILTGAPNLIRNISATGFISGGLTDMGRTIRGINPTSQFDDLRFVQTRQEREASRRQQVRAPIWRQP